MSVKIAIRDRIYFAKDKSRIRSKYFPALKRVASVLKRFPAIKKVRIDGYAGDKRSSERNQWLSEQRALEVKSFLMKNGVDPSRLEIRGFGQPEEGGAGEADRRVEFTIVDPPQGPP